MRHSLSKSLSKKKKKKKSALPNFSNLKNLDLTLSVKSIAFLNSA